MCVAVQMVVCTAVHPGAAVGVDADVCGGGGGVYCNGRRCSGRRCSIESMQACVEVQMVVCTALGVV